MAEYSANAVQTVNPGETIIFTETPVPCNRGLVRHRDDTGNFLLSGYVPINMNGCRCYYNRVNSANYLIDFGANIAIPTGGTPGAISLAIQIDGSTVSSSTMTVTPAAVEQFFNVSRAINAQIWRGCCETIAIRNTSDQPILVQNANIIITRPDLVISR